MPPDATTEAPPKPKTPRLDWHKTILGDIGKVLDETTGEIKDAPPPDPAPSIMDSTDYDPLHPVTIGEQVRFKKEREELEAEKKADKKEEPPKPKEEPKKETTVPEEKPEEKKPEEPPKKKSPEVVKQRPLEDIVTDIVLKVHPPAPPPPVEQPKKEEPKPDPDAEFISQLEDAQKEEIEFARYAAKAMPEKYGTMPQLLVKFYRDADAYFDKKRSEDPDWDPENDEGVVTLDQEHRPKYSGADRKRLERQQIAEEAEARVEAKYAPRFKQAEQAKRLQDLTPELDQAVESYRPEVLQEMAVDEKSPLAAVIPHLMKGDMEAAKEIDPLATRIVTEQSQNALRLGREYMELAVGAKEQDPNNHTQAQLFAWIAYQEDYFLKNGGDQRMNQGRHFVTRAQYSSMTPEQQQKAWTLTHTDVLRMLKIAAAQNAAAAIKKELDQRQAEGYVRQPKAKDKKAEEKKEEKTSKKEESPKATTTPAPGAGNPPPPAQPPSAFSEAEWQKYLEPGASRIPI